ncbi:conserved hypothetical protein [Uncinocarpus reesii 1704]|uniref:DNA topoisomerase (ATP-hydrolyzing) n=1 Tax=Uncinocarpus reesii (strain UAMH 1704) TaxID=336963 RepID=C4JLT4_UNCRE|nr:uncharacterized protein UREG_03792 [Uncinocarpus reesii 1704]EEP78946.1 conserved hypothetical protein [Uncinocarpus reesii 1704]
MSMTGECPGASANSHDEDKVKQFLEAQLSSVVDELSKPDGRPSLTLKRRPTRANCSLNVATGALQANGHGRECVVTYSWPGKTAREAWAFGVVVRILGHISEAIHGQFVASKRDIYYLDPAYFGSQRLVDTYIDDIAYTIGVGRPALHVGILIPRVDEIAELDLSGVRWVLVIEKEAVFHRLVTSNYHKSSTAGGGMLITGKGYPDLSTRAFLRLWKGNG